MDLKVVVIVEMELVEVIRVLVVEQIALYCTPRFLTCLGQQCFQALKALQ